MKKIILIAGLFTLTLAPVFSQEPLTRFRGRLVPDNGSPTNAPLTRFNLDFPGGSPRMLVESIELAMAHAPGVNKDELVQIKSEYVTGKMESVKPLNVIISDEDNNDVQLPALKMNDVDVVVLFHALEQASLKQVAVKTGNNGSYSIYPSAYGFKPNIDGAVTDSSIWYFHADKPALPPVVESAKIIQYYSLEQYLNRGLTVDDITTAIQTGWKMAGIKPTPDLNYHKETKMLIAYGESGELATIQNVLRTLPTAPTSKDIFEEMYNKLNNHVSDLQIKIDRLEKKSSGTNSPLTLP